MKYSYSKTYPIGQHLQGGYLLPVNIEEVADPDGGTQYRFHLLKFKEPPTQAQIDRYLALGADVQRHSEKRADWIEKLPEQEELAESLPELTIGGILASELTAEEMAAILEHYPEFEVGKSYALGEFFRYDNKLWKIAQAHTSQADWIPGSVPALYVEIAPPGVIPVWVQPEGAHDAYDIGDRVQWPAGGQVWESTIPANVTEPGTLLPWGYWVQVE